MNGRSINYVFAKNLADAMERKGWNQSALAKKSGVAQKTISNCLHPSNRESSAKGKEPSTTLTILAKLAETLGESPWDMIRYLSPSEREVYKSVDNMLYMQRQLHPTSELPVEFPEQKYQTPATQEGTEKRAA